MLKEQIGEKDMAAIAIDGPAGAGKSTIAKRVAKELGYICRYGCNVPCDCILSCDK